MGEFERLMTAVNQKLDKLQAELAETNDGLVTVAAELTKLPENYIPRSEAEVRAAKIKKGFVALVVACLLGGLFVINLNARFTNACSSQRKSLVAVINTAVADRQPLPTSSPEARAAIEEQNARIREFREHLLALPGVDPDKC